jgi:hypothetical protein
MYFTPKEKQLSIYVLLTALVVHMSEQFRLNLTEQSLPLEHGFFLKLASCDRSKNMRALVDKALAWDTRIMEARARERSPLVVVTMVDTYSRPGGYGGGSIEYDGLLRAGFLHESPQYIPRGSTNPLIRRITGGDARVVLPVGRKLWSEVLYTGASFGKPRILDKHIVVGNEFSSSPILGGRDDLPRGYETFGTQKTIEYRDPGPNLTTKNHKIECAMYIGDEARDSLPELLQMNTGQVQEILRGLEHAYL